MAPVNLSPPSDLQQEVFPLQASHMSSLQFYTYLGIQLPTTAVDYQSQYDLGDATIKKFQQNVNAIVKVHADIREHAKRFKNRIFPTIVDLASAIYNYSTTAKLYYSALYDAINSIDQANKRRSAVPIDGLIERNKQRIYELIEGQVSAMINLQRKAANVVKDLKAFEQETTGDEKNAKVEMTELASNMITQGVRTDVIAQLQRDIGNDYSNARQKKKWFHGARELISRMTRRKSDITAADLSSCKRMTVQASQILEHLRKILEMVGPAIATVDSMQNCFKAITDDLESIKAAVGSNVREAVNIIDESVNIGAVEQSWEALGNRADYYRKTAYVTQLDTTTGIVGDSSDSRTSS